MSRRDRGTHSLWTADPVTDIRRAASAEGVPGNYLDPVSHAQHEMAKVRIV
jgi:hypothetical protein